MPKDFCRSLSIQVKWRFSSLRGPCRPRTTGWGLIMTSSVMLNTAAPLNLTKQALCTSCSRQHSKSRLIYLIFIMVVLYSVPTFIEIDDKIGIKLRLGKLRHHPIKCQISDWVLAWCGSFMRLIRFKNWLHRKTFIPAGKVWKDITNKL